MIPKKVILLGIIGAVGGAVAVSFSGAAGSSMAKRYPQVNKFDFYLLSTQWIPGWCEAGTGQSGADLDQIKSCQQQASKPLMFHGLWPEYKDGSYPSSCSEVPDLKSDNLDFENPYRNYLTNANRFINHEWAKHGTCSNYYSAGLESSNSSLYYQNVNRYFNDGLRQYQKIAYSTLKMETTATEIRTMLHVQNPQIPESSILVICDGNDSEKYLTGLWFCMDKKVDKFVDCPEILIRKNTCSGTILTR